MEETTFTADPMRLMLAAAVGIVILLVLIIKFKLHPVLSMMISAIIIGAGAGMPLEMISDTVEKGVGKTLQGIALLVGLGSMFGGILEVSGGAQRIAETLIDKFGQKKAGWALGLTGLVIGTTVFFEAGVVVLIPLVFSVAKQTKKSTLYYAIPLLSGLASGYAFVPPSAGSVLVANALGVNLGTMIMVGVPTALICMLVSGIIWGNLVGNKIFTELPANVEEIKDDGKELPPFGLVLGVIAGSTHGLRSAVMNHILDTLLSIPSLLLAIIVVAFAGPHLSHAMFAVWLALLPRMVRSVYSMVHDELEKEYIIAARLDGASTLNILLFAILPNIASGLVTEITRALSMAILDIAALGFLDLGAQLPSPEWGAMLGDALELIYVAPWTVMLPGAAIMLSVLLVNLLGDGIRRAIIAGVE